MKELRAALARRDDAERRIDQILKTDFTPGVVLAYEYRGKRRIGRVTMNCYGDRLQVVNIDTGSFVFITAAAIRGAP